MDSPTLYKWHITDDDLESGHIYDESETHNFTLNDTEIKFGLILQFPDEDIGEEYCKLYLKLLNLAAETSVVLQFRLWLENGVGKKITKKRFEFKHTFTKINEKAGAKKFFLDDQLFSAMTDFDKYKSITFCCEVLRIKPEPETLPDSKFREEIYSLYNSGITENCVLKANGQEFNVPKSFLMASSEVFKNMLTSNSRLNTIKIEDVSAEIIEKFINYLHTGNFDESDQLIEGLFVFANRYSIESLMELCIQALIKTLTKGNVALRLKLAFIHNNAELKNRLLFYLTNHRAEGNFYEMMKSDEWHKLAGENKQLASEIVDAYVSGTKSL